MNDTNAATGNAMTVPGRMKMARWPVLVVGLLLVLGCAAPEQRHANNKPGKCHGGQILSCDVKGHGQTKSYSNCRCTYPREINTGLSGL